MMNAPLQKIVWLGLACCLIAAGSALASQQVYRCQGADGKPVFSDKPCGKHAETVNVKVPPRPGVGIGMRCVFNRDMKACEEYRNLRETDPQAWQEELMRVNEAMQARRVEQHQNSAKYQECVQRNTSRLAGEQRSLSGYHHSYIQGRCYENPEIVVHELPADPSTYRSRKRYISPGR